MKMNIEELLNMNTELSFKAIGLYHKIKYNLSNGEKVSIESLRTDVDGVKSVSSGLKELIEKGYIERVITREKGKLVNSTYRLLK